MPSASRSLAELDDAGLVGALREGDEAVFARLMQTYNSALLRVAATHVSSRAVAEEVVQETWLAVIRGLERFEGRSSLKTWIFKILTKIASTQGAREHRTVPFCSLDGDDGRPFDADRFFPDDNGRLGGHWRPAPTRWETPADAIVSGEIREVVAGAIEALPASQRAVISLRDVEGWPAADTCAALGLSDGNQRILLHRARTKVRAVLERYYADL
jgi:RNA polymerase sigma-70 factor (ECF subfamily)